MLAYEENIKIFDRKCGKRKLAEQVDNKCNDAYDKFGRKNDAGHSKGRKKAEYPEKYAQSE